MRVSGLKMLAGRLARDRRGGAAMIAAAAMPVLVGFGALAVDMGAVQLDTRRLQGIADAAALAAARDPASAESAARAVVAASGFPRAIAIRVATGHYADDARVTAAGRFGASGGADAARVALETTSPTFLAAIFGKRDVSIARTATARRQRFAAFSIGSRLAGFDGGLLNAYLGALTGSNVSLGVMDYRALADAQIDLLALLPQLRTRAGLQALTFDEILKSRVSVGQTLEAIALTLDGGGSSAAAATVRTLAASAGGRTIMLSTLIDAGPFAGRTEGASGIARVDTLPLITALLQLAGPTRQVAFDLAGTIPGVSSIRVAMAVGERAQQSPWVTITENGAPIVRTAQMRLYARARLAPTLLPGIGSLAAIELPIVIELAAAEGRLAGLECGSFANRAVTLEARTNAGSAAIGSIDEARLGDFSQALDPGRATFVDTPLVDVVGSSRIALGAAEPWQQVRFDAAALAAGDRRTVRSTNPVTGIAASLVSQASLSVVVVGLPVPADPLVRAVGLALQGIAPALDTLLMTATGAVGVGISEADLRVTGMRCGEVALVG